MRSAGSTAEGSVISLIYLNHEEKYHSRMANMSASLKKLFIFGV